MAIFTNKQFGILVAAAAVGGYLVYRKGREAVQAVNPADPDNYFNSLVNEQLDLADDGKVNDSTSLGSRIFDFFNPDQGKLLNLDE